MVKSEESTSYKVIVLDDDVKIHKIIKKFFQKGKITVKSLYKSESIFKENLNDFDAILLDYFFKDDHFNGLEILKYVRSNNKFINIILITGVSSEQLAIDAIRFNIDDYLVKPINFKNLTSLVIRSINKRQNSFYKMNFLEVEKKEDFFDNILIINDSFPIFGHGSWLTNGKYISSNEIIIGGFLSAIQNFSSTYFGESLVEISLNQEKLLFYKENKLTVCLRVSNEDYRTILTLKNKKVILEQLKEILSYVVQNYSLVAGNKIPLNIENGILKLLTESNKVLFSNSPNITAENKLNEKKQKLDYLINKIEEQKYYNAC